MNWYARLKAGIESLSNHRRIRSRMFSGNPVLLNVGRKESRGNVNMTLRFKNGLILTLGDEGILDFQDKDFAQFLDSPGFTNRDAMAYLHKMVLKCLIRHMVHPMIEPSQRERAAEAASKLYLAEAEATSDWRPGPAAALVGETAGSAR